MNSLLQHQKQHSTGITCHPWCVCQLAEHHGRSVRGRPPQASAGTSRIARRVPDGTPDRGRSGNQQPTLKSPQAHQQRQRQQQQQQQRQQHPPPAKEHSPAPKLPLQVVLHKLNYDYDQLKNWQVQLRQSGAVVGSVTKVTQTGPVSRPGKGGRRPGPSSILLQVVKQSVLEPYGYQGREVHRIPLVPDIVSHADPVAQTLYITPPPGLLEMGRQQLLQGFLSVELLPLARPVGVPGGLPGSPLFPDRWMPTRLELVEAGRQDLVELIQDLGGFTQAALLLGLRSRRRPPGYWEQVELLGAELEAFVWGSWLALPDPEAPGDLYYYNMVTQAVRWEAPPPPPGIWSAVPSPSTAEVPPSQPRPAGLAGSSTGSEVPAAGTMPKVAEGIERKEEEEEEEEEEGEVEDSMNEEEERQLQELHVMPTAKAVAQAGRWDLHHAIIAQGGYKRVGDMLGWRPARCSTAPYLSNLDRLRGELEGVGLEFGLPSGRMPTRQQLVEAGQHTLAYAVAQLGGWQVVSKQLGLTSQRQPRTLVPATPQQLADAMRHWMAANPPPAVTLDATAAHSTQLPSSAVRGAHKSGMDGAGAAAGPASRSSNSSSISSNRAAGSSSNSSSTDRAARSSGMQHARWSQLPTQKQLLAVGRRDLVAGLRQHGARSVAALLGLPVSAQGPTTKGRVTLPLVQEAIGAGADTPAKIRIWLSSRLAEGLPSVAQPGPGAAIAAPPAQALRPSPRSGSVGAEPASTHNSSSSVPWSDVCNTTPGNPPVSREHLTVLLRGWVQDGHLVKVQRGRYALSSGVAGAAP